MQLQQLLPRRGPHFPLNQAGFQQGLRFRCERQAAIHLSNVQRLDAEGIARQRHTVLMPLMDRDRIHSPQLRRVIISIAQPIMQWHLAVGVRGEVHAWHRGAQFPVVVNLPVRYQRRRTGEKRLVAGDQVDDGKAVVQECHAADDGMARAIGTAMMQAVDQAGNDGGIGRRGARRQNKTGDTAHKFALRGINEVLPSWRVRCQPESA